MGDAIRASYLNGVVIGLEAYGVSPAELPTLMGFVYADGVGSPRWSLAEWVAAVLAWIEDRLGIEKAYGGVIASSASKAYPNWLKPHEIEAWKFARDRAGLRIEGIEDTVRAKLRAVLADTITLAMKTRKMMVEHVAEKMEKAFEGLEKDWERVARTELASAFNEGVVVQATAKGVKKFIVKTETDACPKCKKTYDGKTFTTAALLKVMPPILHPNCRCVPAPAPVTK